MRHLLIPALVLTVACEDAQSEHTQECDSIDIVELTIGDQTYGYRFEPDAEAPVVDPIVVPPNSTLDVSVRFFEGPGSWVDRTSEVLDGADFHQVFMGSRLMVGFSYDDDDSMGFPVGLQGQIDTRGPGTGVFEVVLQHFEQKYLALDDVYRATGAQSLPGEVDVAATFPITIQ